MSNTSPREMEREEKVLEAALASLSTRCQDLKNSLSSLLYKLENEYETLNWPSALDSFALISGQINNMMKVLKNDKTPALRNRILLPLLLSLDRDEELMKLTEGRVQAFNHEMVPDYLRTKLEPEIESKEQQLFSRSDQISLDNGQKQITSVNKITNHIIEVIKNNRESWDSESTQRVNAAQTTSSPNTYQIIAAISLGKGLKPSVLGSPKGAATIQPPQQSQQPGPRPLGPKVPSTIKTNIKSASSVTPYSR